VAENFVKNKFSSFLNEIPALAGFIFLVSQDDIACFIDNTRTKNNARKTHQDFGPFKAFFEAVMTS